GDFLQQRLDLLDCGLLPRRAACLDILEFGQQRSSLVNMLLNHVKITQVGFPVGCGACERLPCRRRRPLAQPLEPWHPPTVSRFPGNPPLLTRLASQNTKALMPPHPVSICEFSYWCPRSVLSCQCPVADFASPLRSRRPHRPLNDPHPKVHSKCEFEN